MNTPKERALTEWFSSPVQKVVEAMSKDEQSAAHFNAGWVKALEHVQMLKPPKPPKNKAPK